MQIKEMLSTPNWILTGSRVLNVRTCKDTDIICYKDDILVETTGDEFIRTAFIDGRKYEFLLADNQESLQKILEMKEYLTSLEIYYILKSGHIHITGRSQDKWETNIHDYHILRKILKAHPQTDWKAIEELVKLHRKTTNARIKQGTPRLKGVSKDEFFDDFVEKYIDHDRIHEEVAYGSAPAYTLMQKDQTVECHKDLWEQMSFEDKLRCVAEETSVIAIERQVLPFMMKKKQWKPVYLSYKWALYRICTTLCSGWFRQFAIDNYYTVLNMFNEEKLNNNILNVGKLIQETNECS